MSVEIKITCDVCGSHRDPESNQVANVYLTSEHINGKGHIAEGMLEPLCDFDEDHINPGPEASTQPHHFCEHCLDALQIHLGFWVKKRREDNKP